MIYTEDGLKTLSSAFLCKEILFAVLQFTTAYAIIYKRAEHGITEEKMKLFRHRPFVFASFCSIVALLLCFFLPVALSLVLGIVFFAVSVIPTYKHKRFEEGYFGQYTGFFMAAACVMCGAMCISSYIYYGIAADGARKCFTDNETVFKAYYTDGHEGMVYAPNGKKIKCVIDVEGENVGEYTYFTFSGALTGIEEYTDNESYYLSRNVLGYCTGKLVEVLDSSSDPMQYFKGLQNYAVSRTNKYCADQSGFVSGLVFGDRDNIPDEVYSYYKRTGTTHLCAVSGMHLIAILALTDMIFKKLLRMKIPGLIISLTICVVYVLLTGAAMSVLRAGIMYLFCNGSFFLKNRSDSLTTLFFSAFLLYFLCPYALFDVGLALSLCSTYGILAFGVPTSEELDKYLKRRLPKPLKDPLMFVASSFLISLSASFAVIPVLMIYYGEFHVFSSLTTFMLSPSITAILYLAPLCVIFSFFEPVAALCGSLASAFSVFCTQTIKYCASTLDAVVSLEYVFSLPFLIIVFVMYGIMLYRKAKRSDFLYFTASILTLYIVIACVCDAFYAKNSYVIIQNTDNGDAVCIVSDSRAVMLDYTDGGDSDVFVEILDGLGKHGIKRLDSFVMVNTESYNFKTVSNVCSRITIDKLYVPDKYAEDEEEYAKLVSYSEKCGGKLIRYYPSAATTVSELSCKITLLKPYGFEDEVFVPFIVEKNERVLYVPYSSFDATRVVKKYMSDDITIVYGARYEAEAPFTMIHNGRRMYITEYVKDKLAREEYAKIVKEGCEGIIREGRDVIDLN